MIERFNSNTSFGEGSYKSCFCTNCSNVYKVFLQRLEKRIVQIKYFNFSLSSLLVCLTVSGQMGQKALNFLVGYKQPLLFHYCHINFSAGVSYGEFTGRRLWLDW